MRKSLYTLLQVIILAGLILALTPAEKGLAADPPPPIFLPLVMKPASGISGHVTLWGEPAEGVELWLFHNSSDVIQTAMTDSTGYYLFSPPILLPGDEYLIYFVNLSSHPDGRIATWSAGPRIYTYIDPSNLGMPDFDIADVYPLSPVTDSSVSLPVTFHWQKHPGSVGSTYMLVIYVTGLGWVGTPWLGDVDSYTMTTLPPEIPINDPSWWKVWVMDANGGIGQPFFHATVTFLDRGTAGESVLSPILMTNEVYFSAFSIR